MAGFAANLLIFAFLMVYERALRRRGRPPGWPFDGFEFLLFVLLHCAQRLAVEFWRADTPRLAGPFTWPQLFCAVGIGLAVWLGARGFAQTHEGC